MARPLSPHALMVLVSLRDDGDIVYPKRSSSEKEPNAATDLYLRVVAHCQEANRQNPSRQVRVSPPHRRNFRMFLEYLNGCGKIAVKTEGQRTYSVKLLKSGRDAITYDPFLAASKIATRGAIART